jgi:hypothetical protein
VVIAVCGALGGFVNVFIGDSGLHLPTIIPGDQAGVKYRMSEVMR